MKNVSFNRLAEQELTEAFQFYESERAGLGGELREEVRHGLLFLIRYPRLAPVIRGEIRRFVLPRFPYSLLYRPAREGEIRILAIAHHSRRPDYWIERD